MPPGINTTFVAIAIAQINPKASDMGHNLTFSVEWQFLINPNLNTPDADLSRRLQVYKDAVGATEALDSWTSTRQKWLIARISCTLQQQGIEAMSLYEAEHTRTVHGDVIDDNPGYFIVRADRSVRDMVRHASLNEDLISAEIVSPLLPANDDGKRFLRAAFGVVLKAFRCKVNFTCGFHVHIGNQELGYPLDWLRNTAALCWAASPLLDRLHPAHRGPGNRYCYGVRYFARLAHETETQELKGPQAPQIEEEGPQQQAHASDRHGLALTELYTSTKLGSWINDSFMGWCGAERLARCETAEEVVRLMGSVGQTHRLAYSVVTQRGSRSQAEKSAGSQKRNPQFVEFRQHQGTVDLEEMLMWVSVCSGLVECCRGTRSHWQGHITLKSVNGAMGLGSYDALDLIRDVVAADIAEFYRPKLAKYSTESKEPIIMMSAMPSRHKSSVLNALGKIARYVGG